MLLLIGLAGCSDYKEFWEGTDPECSDYLSGRWVRQYGGRHLLPAARIGRADGIAVAADGTMTGGLGVPVARLLE